jgi:murein DD-endopeptidase MepM/ murein hydrolase activator NlpD
MFYWPTKSRRVTSQFGKRNIGDGWHDGIDIGDESHSAPYEDEIFASHDGKVAFVGYVGGYGNNVIIINTLDLSHSTLYAHCKDVVVTVGQLVKHGTKIATMGKELLRCIYILK